MNRLTAGKLRQVAVWAVICVVLSLQPSTLFAGDQDFTLHNSTGKEIAMVYVSSADTNDWEEDVLGTDTLLNNTSVDISFSRSEDAEDWDLKVVFANGEEAIWEDLRLTEITDVTISFRRGKPYATTQNGD